MKISILVFLCEKSSYYLSTTILFLSFVGAFASDFPVSIQKSIFRQNRVTSVNFTVDTVCREPICVPYAIAKTISNCDCVNCLQLQPNKTFSKEATISSYIPNENRSSSILDIGGVAQTNSGLPNITRTLLDFDLTTILEGTQIKKAELYLYGHPSTPIGANQPPNELEIYRITSNWDQSTVTWNTQPTFDSSVKVTLISSTNDYANFKVDVTELVQNYLNNKNGSCGFMLKLLTETPYRRLIFASSKSANRIYILS